MPPGSHQGDLPVSRDERKRLLMFACAADRLAWVQACEPPPEPPLAKAGHLLQFIEPFVGFLPGRVGRWIRNAHFVGSLLPTVGKYFLKNLTGAAARSAQTESAENGAKPGKPRSRPSTGS